MKKIMFVALALLMGLASCVKDKQYPGITISNVSYTPTAVQEETPVTVTATITSFKEILEAKVVYTIDEESLTLAMTKGADDLYSAVIPAYPDGTTVSFYVEADNIEVTAASPVMEYTVGAVAVDYSVLRLNELNGDTKFIEIYNKGNVDLSLEGMYIMKDDYVAGATWTADASVVAPAGGYVLLYSEDVTLDHPEVPETLIFHSGLSAKKTVRITLFMPDGTVRDEYTRGTEWGLTISNVAPQSFARTPDGGDWKLADPTPGEANPAEGEDIPQE